MHCNNYVYFCVIDQSIIYFLSSNNAPQSQLYEAASEVYKLVIPIYEQRRKYHSLESIYNKLSDCFKSLAKKGDKRFLGSYFRVGFYGWMFGDLHNKEFIYKEEALMRLSEFCVKLEVRKPN